MVFFLSILYHLLICHTITHCFNNHKIVFKNINTFTTFLIPRPTYFADKGECMYIFFWVNLFPYFKCHITRTIKIRTCALKIKLLLKISTFHNVRLKKNQINKQRTKKRENKNKNIFLDQIINI